MTLRDCGPTTASNVAGLHVLAARAVRGWYSLFTTQPQKACRSTRRSDDLAHVLHTDN